MDYLSDVAEYLVSQGHHYGDLMEYGIVQLLTFRYLAYKRVNSEQRVLLGVTRLAYHGTQENVKAFLNEE